MRAKLYWAERQTVPSYDHPGAGSPLFQSADIAEVDDPIAKIVDQDAGMRDLALRVNRKRASRCRTPRGEPHLREMRGGFLKKGMRGATCTFADPGANR
jgi:hypothetical protein